MRNTMFVSDDREIDLLDRKCMAGERGTAEMCSHYCSKMGRGHVHYLDCEKASHERCLFQGSREDMRRHCTRKLEPKPAKAQDEVLHERFWGTLGWEDPCSSIQERTDFAKCAYKCDAAEHAEGTASYCVMPTWHAPAAKPSGGGDHFSYICGHEFECSHVSTGGKMHHMFVLDASGSMNGRPWRRLVAAFEEYLRTREAKAGSLDVVSVVTFDNEASIVYEGLGIATMQSRASSIPYRGGGTSFNAGLRCAIEVLSRVDLQSYTPVVVLFSDGRVHDHRGETLATYIAQTYGTYGLKAFSVGFGTVNLSSLERIAELLGGSYCQVLIGDDLPSTFRAISESVGTPAGLALTTPVHELVCSVCHHELASEPTTVLTPCQHRVHTRCLQQLGGATGNQHEKRCPSCHRDIHGE